MLHKEMLRRNNRTPYTQLHPASPQDDHQLAQIVKTFRENHLKLIQKIQECDKKREFEHQLSKRKQSEKYLIDRHEYQHPRAFEGLPRPRPFSQLKTDRNRDYGVKENRRENINNELKRNSVSKFQECEEGQTSPYQDQPFKLIKIKTSKLVPLSMDKLRERLKLL